MRGSAIFFALKLKLKEKNYADKLSGCTAGEAFQYVFATM